MKSLRQIALSMAVLVVMVGFAWIGWSLLGRSELAGWVPDPNGHVDAASTHVTIYVNRLGCPTRLAADDVTVEVVSLETAVVLTARVPPDFSTGAGTCTAVSRPVRVEVELGAALGDRQLLDGRFDPPRPPEATEGLFVGGLPISR